MEKVLTITWLPTWLLQQPRRTPRGCAALHQLRGPQRQQHQADVARLVPSQDAWLRGEP